MTTTVASFLDLKKLKDTKASGGNREYFAKSGTFLVLVQSAKLDVKRGGAGFYATENKIITTTLPDDKDYQPGRVRNMYTPNDGTPQGEMFLPNIKNAIEATLGVGPAEIAAMTDAEFAQVVEGLLGQAQGMAGQYLIVRAVAGVTKKGPRAGMPNCVATYYHPTPEELTAAGLVRDGNGTVIPMPQTAAAPPY